MMRLDEYTYSGARSMVLLHERKMREFLQMWKFAKSMELPLPECDDPDYETLDTLLVHVLGAAGGYMRWMCKRLELPDPEILKVPGKDEIESRADDYLEHVVDRWKAPLRDVPEERFHRPEYPSGWKVLYCIDAMMEHAVMHPVRHTFQLEWLIKNLPRTQDTSGSVEVTLREITEKTLIDIIRLNVMGSQQRFVADNKTSIAEAHFSKHAWFRGIYAGDTPVGFVMLHDEPEKPEYFLWRFMIAADHQGRGYGSKAIRLLVDYVKTRPNATELLTSVIQADGGPQPFYESLGFSFTGDFDDGEAILKLPLTK